MVLVVYDKNLEQILSVQEVPQTIVISDQIAVNGVIENSPKRIVVDDTIILKELFTMKGYDISKIEEYENSLVV